jgi:hypothetical protein
VVQVARQSSALAKERAAHADEHADWVHDQAADTRALAAYLDHEAGTVERATHREVHERTKRA